MCALLLVACTNTRAGTEGSTTGPPEAQTITIGMDDKLRYDPSTVKAKVGTVTLTVSNTGTVPHDLRFDGNDLGRTSSIDGDRSEDLSVVFPRAGTFTFVCTLHSGMDGKVVVSAVAS